jgi:hypothetical protein
MHSFIEFWVLLGDSEASVGQISQSSSGEFMLR